MRRQYLKPLANMLYGYCCCAVHFLKRGGDQMLDISTTIVISIVCGIIANYIYDRLIK